MAAAVASEE